MPPIGSFTAAEIGNRNVDPETGLLNFAPAANAYAVTPTDGDDLEQATRGLMVSATGDVKVNFLTTGTEIVLAGLLPGVVYPFQITKVFSTDTTATGIIALY